MRVLPIALSFALAMGSVFAGCEEEAEESAEAPDPVAPVEVTDEPSAPQAVAVEGTEGSAATGPNDVEALRTRVAELEEQLAACQSGSPTAPTEVTVRDPAPGAGSAGDTTEDDADDDDADDDRQATGSRRGRSGSTTNNDPASLIDQVLGGRRGRQGDDGQPGPIVLDPGRLLGGQ